MGMSLVSCFFYSCGIVNGFGAGQGSSPDALQQVRLPLIDLSVCNKTDWYGAEWHIDDSMVCAGYEHGGRDTCQVDRESGFHEFKKNKRN